MNNNRNKLSPASQGEVIIYSTGNKGPLLEVKMKGETVWLNQNEIAALFNTERSVVTKHLGSIFKSSELIEKSNVQKMHIAFSDKPVKYYNLDVIISVGYRVNSSRATQFRIWATQILKKHLVDGYTVNQKRLLEHHQKLKNLQKTIKLIHNSTAGRALNYKEATGLLEIIDRYSYALGLLDDYDKKTLKVSNTSNGGRFKLRYEAVTKAVREMKAKCGGSEIFGKEKDQSLKSSIATIYQTFEGQELYPSIEEKAANLLYFIVKNHSFIDGNKRIAAAVFLWFLEKHCLLYRADGSKRLADNALVALTLMIAESRPQEKDVMATLIVSLINKKN
ncbi:MAG: virulence protein RhuM/Fic/DOC family protein [Elusimicrobiota bacterium]